MTTDQQWMTRVNRYTMRIGYYVAPHGLTTRSNRTITTDTDQRALKLKWLGARTLLLEVMDFGSIRARWDRRC